MKWGFFKLKGTDFSLKEGANFNGNLKKKSGEFGGMEEIFDVIEKEI